MENLTNTTNTSSLLYLNETVSFHKVVRGLYLYGILPIVVIGIIGNLWSFKVFMFTSFNKHSPSIYLAMLSIADTFSLLALILGWIHTFHNDMADTEGLCLASAYITNVTSLSVWYVVFMVRDRFLVVRYPLRSYRFCSKRQSLISAAAVTVVGVVCNSISFFLTKISPTADGFLCQLKDDERQIIAVITYIDIGNSFVLPFVTIFVLNFITIVKLRTFRVKRVTARGIRRYSPSNNVLSDTQVILAMMLIKISIVFFFFDLPAYGIRFYILVKDVVHTNDSALFLAQQICQILHYVKFSINFTLYVSSSEAFRRCLFEKARF